MPYFLNAGLFFKVKKKLNRRKAHKRCVKNGSLRINTEDYTFETLYPALKMINWAEQFNLVNPAINF